MAFASWLLVNCAPGDNNGFTGTAGKQDQPIQNLPAVESCKQASLVGLNTTGAPVINQATNTRSLAFELLFAPCNNPNATPMALDAAFDIDSDWKTSGGGKPYDGMNISYKITPEGQAMRTDYLTFKFGADLFGNSGPEYFKLLSSQPINLPPTVTRAAITIDLSGVLIIPRDPALARANAPIQIYFKVGDANPVSGTVTVTPTN